MSACVVVDYADTPFWNFAIKYLRKNEKVNETIFARSYGAQVKSFKLNFFSQKSRDTVQCPFNILARTWLKEGYEYIHVRRRLHTSPLRSFAT